MVQIEWSDMLDNWEHWLTEPLMQPIFRKCYKTSSNLRSLVKNATEPTVGLSLVINVDARTGAALLPPPPTRVSVSEVV